MQKKYQLFLCEDYFEGTNPDKPTEGVFKERRVCEIASRDATSLSQAYNIEFYSKIDGTHELSFELARYYFDSELGEQVKNPLVELIVNKSKIEVIIEDKTYFITINGREDREEGNVFSYSYTGTDSFIEELSKTGYGLVFSDEVEGNGLGTIHELAARVLDGTDWEYDKAKTGTLFEYTTDLSYNIEQGRYDNVYLPVPVHPIKYIPELSRYCYALDVMIRKTYLTGGNAYHRIYCYDTTEQVTSATVQNLIYNADDFVDVVGWQSYSINTNGDIVGGLLVETTKLIEQEENENGELKNKNVYCMQLKSSPETNTAYLLNETAADANKNIIANMPYAFRFITKGGIGNITKVHLYNKNPLMYPNEAPDYTLAKEEGALESNVYYTIKTKTSFNKPYLVLEVENCREENNGLIIERIELFEVKGKEALGKNAEENNLDLLSILIDGSLIEGDNLSKMVLLTEEKTISAYTHGYVQYFYRENYKVFSNGEEEKIKEEKEDAVYYLDFEKEVNVNNNYIFSTWGQTSPYPSLFFPKEYYGVADDNGNIFVDDLPEKPDEGDKDKIYHLRSDGKYYQYYEVTRNGITNGKWDYALYGSGANDKRRTLSVEKSNRFNIIQELAELFKVWPVFDIQRNEKTGELTKKIWFRESCIRENFSGFHKGVNLLGLTRNIRSDEVVTKMYVEDVESDFADDGFVTIRKAELNPWGENYYYNFQYYVNQKLLNTVITTNGTTELLVEYDLHNLYTTVKGINAEIFTLNDRIANTSVELSNLNAQLTTLAVSIASMTERITALGADKQAYEDKLGEEVSNLPDYKNLDISINNYIAQKAKYEEKQNEIQNKRNTLQIEYDEYLSTVSARQEEKQNLIDAFERKYAQYIKEGVWSDSSYVDNNTYFYDSQKVMNTSSVPKTDWEISVLDGSVFQELSDYKVEVGDKTFLVDNEFFGIEKNVEENYVFEVLISGIREYLDNPVKNSIEVRNYRTSFEDLFQRISAATQTLELNEQTYDKAAFFSADGQIDKNILQNTLLQNALILANATDNSYSLDNTGLYLQSVLNPAKKMRAIADGVFLSNSLNKETGDPEWKTGITADGINASLLTAGEINTSVIKIYSDGQPNFSWNKLGITAYKMDWNETEKKNIVNSSAFVRLDSYGVYSVKNDSYTENGETKNYFQTDANGKPWFEGLKTSDALQRIIDHSTVSITNIGFNLNIAGEGLANIRLGYKDIRNSDLYGLYITDKEGKETVKLQNDGNNYIAGWTIAPGYLQYYGDGEQVCRIDANGQNGVDLNGNIKYWDYWFYCRDSKGDENFKVTKEGILYAKGAHINGSIEVTDGGLIGGWKITDNSLVWQSGLAKFVIDGSASGAATGTGGSGYWLYAQAGDGVRKFSVDRGGTLYATGANIQGTMYADSGEISGNLNILGTVTIRGTPIQSWINGYGDVFKITATTGTIGNWSIDGTSLRVQGLSSKIELHAGTRTDDDPYVLVSNSGVSSIRQILLISEYGMPQLKFDYFLSGIGKKTACLYVSYNNSTQKMELHYSKNVDESGIIIASC